MAKHPRKRHKKDKRRRVYAWPLAPEAFRQAVLRAAEAAGKPHPLLHERVTPHITLRSGRAEELAIALTDTPVKRSGENGKPASDCPRSVVLVWEGQQKCLPTATESSTNGENGGIRILWYCSKKRFQGLFRGLYPAACESYW